MFYACLETVEASNFIQNPILRQKFYHLTSPETIRNKETVTDGTARLSSSQGHQTQLHFKNLFQCVHVYIADTTYSFLDIQNNVKLKLLTK